ncbi:MAG: hypothetical protein GY752_05450 [bacterium]|nr:hypothetical protein [bacterium]
MEEGSVVSFSKFLELRGYSLSQGSGAFLRRLFLDSWVQPGFHRFWQVWNPVYGYFLFRLYRAMGGSRRPFVAGISVFVFCGAVLHDLPMGIVSGEPKIVCTIAFSSWGLLAFLSRRMDVVFDFESWPNIANLCVNILFIAWGLFVGGLGQKVLLV